jgi:hypothetical protein
MIKFLMFYIFHNNSLIFNRLFFYLYLPVSLLIFLHLFVFVTIYPNFVLSKGRYKTQVSKCKKLGFIYLNLHIYK